MSMIDVYGLANTLALNLVVISAVLAKEISTRTMIETTGGLCMSSGKCFFFKSLWGHVIFRIVSNSLAIFLKKLAK